MKNKIVTQEIGKYRSFQWIWNGEKSVEAETKAEVEMRFLRGE